MNGATNERDVNGYGKEREGDRWQSGLAESG